MQPANDEYNDAVKGSDQYGAILCGLIKELLFNKEIQVHSITYRVKDYESAARKLSLKADKYTSFAELTDLLGVRVITYFSNDVDKVAKIIRREFRIDENNSIDKREALDTDRFGYLSLHYVANLSLRRSRLIEYKRFAGSRFELQIRSILQHAWAEIEHDLGYKANGALPEEIQRRFSRLAGSLEGVDEEFERLREEIMQYEKRVDATIKTAPQTLTIDQSTVVAALEAEQALVELDKAIASAGNRALQSNIDTTYAAREAAELRILGVKDIAQLLSYVQRHKNHIVRFAQLWLGDDRKQSSLAPFNRGIGLFYLGYVLAAQLKAPQLEGWGRKIKGRKGDLLKHVKTTWLTVVDELGPPDL